MSTANYWINQLELSPHPEGGFYKETYRSELQIDAKGFESSRNVCTAIYFLLEQTNKSHFHKIKSDELWFFHEGAPIELFILDSDGLKTLVLGKNPDKGESLQLIIPANVWFASRVKDYKGFGLVSCTVAPGFSFEDFEMANKVLLLTKFPNEKLIIEEMTLR